MGCGGEEVGVPFVVFEAAEGAFVGFEVGFGGCLELVWSVYGGVEVVFNAPGLRLRVAARSVVAAQGRGRRQVHHPSSLAQSC